jgi:hypothetical protein
MTYHLRGISKFFSEAPIKMALIIPYLVRGFENFLPEGLIFPLSRDLPLEGEIFSGKTPKNTLLNLLTSGGVPQEHLTSLTRQGGDNHPTTE